MEIVLRCKSKKGQQRLEGLSSRSSLVALLEEIFRVTGIPESSIKILRGFPPKPVSLSDKNCSLDRLGISNGDTLIIEENFTPLIPVISNTSDQHFYPTVPGVLIRKVVPADNSCLFTSIEFAITGGTIHPGSARTMRQIITEIVPTDPETYNDAVLGKSKKEYCKWIMNDESWGGGIEVSILSKYYEMEIVVVDTQNAHINRFGEDANYDQRIFLLYDGIHYDPLYLEPYDRALPIQTVFPVSNDSILQMALELANEAKASKQYTDLQNFSLRCLVCNVGLMGQAGAQQHARETGHTNFGEI